jgi:hypothetical protein
LASGAGLLLAAALSYRLSKRMGMLGTSHARSDQARHA